jgi:hypothetical protein
MCDYSLHAFKSRPAKLGDQLVTTDFFSTLTRGFGAVGERGVAVCVPPGSELAFEKEVKRRMSLFRLFRTHSASKLSGKLARFRRINLDNPNTHHDALEFADGTIVLLTRLAAGQRATVLQLPAQSLSTKEQVAEKEQLQSVS